MDKKLLLLVELLVKDAFSKVEIPQGPQGPRGQRGRDGKDFNLEEHLDSIVELIKQHSKIELSDEQLLSLKGKDGKSVTFSEVIPHLESQLEEKLEGMRESLKLRFEDLTQEEVNSLRGERGHTGEKGKDFCFEENREDISNIVTSFISEIKNELKLRFEDLSLEELESLRGPRGVQGEKGKSFSLEENLEEITGIIKDELESIKPDLKLRFEDLSLEEVESLRGPRGVQGEKGNSFSFEENKEEVSQIISEYILKIKEDLRFKYEDFSLSQLEELRGPKGVQGERGRDGIDGKDFLFEENKENISSIILENKEELKLKFEDLSEEDKQSLRLKFEDLTNENLQEITGPRGQKGKRGERGEAGDKGQDGKTWLVGKGTPTLEAKEGDLFFDYEFCDVFLRENSEWKFINNLRGMIGPIGPQGEKGLQGPRGINGLDGKDGKSAPYITDIKVLETPWERGSYYFVFEFSDGSIQESNSFSLPATIVNNYYSTTSSGTGGGTSLEVLDEGISLGTASKLDFTGDGVTASVSGDKIVVNIPTPSIPTLTIETFESGTKISDTSKLNFEGAGVSHDTLSGVTTVTIPPDTNTTDLKVEESGVSIGTTDTLNFTGNVNVTHSVGKIEVEILGGAGTTDVSVEDEGIEIISSVKTFNFIGPYVTVKPRVPISEWNLLEDVVPSMSEYAGDGTSDTADVYIDVPDSSMIFNVDCHPSVYIGSFIYIDEFEIARNANATSYSTSNVLGVVESKPTSNICNVRVSGISSELFSGLDPALDYFLSDTVDGGISPVVPTASGHVKLKLGQSFGTKKFVFQKGERVVRL